MERSFSRERRLRVRSEFDRVFRQGRRLGGPLFMMIARPNGQSGHRLGIAIGRKVGGAVERNRARRLLREAFRRQVEPAATGFDVVIVARPEIVGRTQGEVDGELSNRFRRLAQRSGNRRASPPSAD